MRVGAHGEKITGRSRSVAGIGVLVLADGVVATEVSGAELTVDRLTELTQSTTAAPGAPR